LFCKAWHLRSRLSASRGVTKPGHCRSRLRPPRNLRPLLNRTARPARRRISHKQRRCACPMGAPRVAVGELAARPSDGRPQVGLSLMLEADFLRAAYPLFEAGEVEVLEWSFDCGWPPTVVARWSEDLLRCYSDAGNLLGHGVSYSPLSAGIDAAQQD